MSPTDTTMMLSLRRTRVRLELWGANFRLTTSF